MKKYFPPTSPIPFKDQYEIDSFTQEHALGDVVKSAAPPRLGFHVDVRAVKGDEPVLDTHDSDHLDHDVSRLGADYHHDDLTDEGAASGETESTRDGDVDTQ